MLPLLWCHMALKLILFLIMRINSALDLFEMTWDNFIKLLSRYSAEIDSQEERDRILQRVSEDGYIDDYAGVRISGKGRRFQITNVVVWNVFDEDRYCGQAALIRDWVFL